MIVFQMEQGRVCASVRFFITICFPVRENVPPVRRLELLGMFLLLPLLSCLGDNRPLFFCMGVTVTGSKGKPAQCGHGHEKKKTDNKVQLFSSLSKMKKEMAEVSL